MGRFLFLLQIFKRIFFLFLIFILLFLQCYLVVYIENLVSCFPVTVITTQKEPVEKMLTSLKVCSVSVQSERMTFDSSIFNHYEMLPVKEIYLYSMKIPYSDWNEVKNMEDVITEANPYIEDIVSFYSVSKMKMWLFLFVFSTVFGLIFVFKTVASNKMSKKQFLAVSIINSLVYLTCSVVVFCTFPVFVLPLSAISAVVPFMAYILMTLMNYKLLNRC